MTTALADVFMICLESFYLLFMLGKEEGKSRMSKAFLFASLVTVHAGMRDLRMPIFLKMVVPVVLVVMAGPFAYEAGRIKLGFLAAAVLILSYASEIVVKLVWGFMNQPVLFDHMGSKGVPFSMMIVATGGTENHATQVTALIMAGASVIAYIIGEGLTDAANIEGEVGIEVQEDTEE